MNYDVIVIGAGLGGLTAGAKLAKEGKKVLLIEQHIVPGGCASTFKRKDFKIEVGLHMIDGLDPGDIKYSVFEELGIFKNLNFQRVPEFYRFVKPGLDITIPDDVEKAVSVLEESFPHEKKGIRNFFKTILLIRKEISRMPRRKWLKLATMPIFPFIFPHVLRHEHATIGQRLDSMIEDDALKLVLLANIGYYHHDPYEMSMLYYSMAQGSYFRGGGYFIRGGSQELSNYLASVIEDRGGKILLGHRVDEIIIDDGAASGVKYSKDGEEKVVYGKCVAANAALPNIMGKLLKDPVAKAKLTKAVGNPKIPMSMLSVYLGFKKPPRELGNRHYSTFIMDEGVSDPKEIAKISRGDFATRTLVFVDYGQLDSGLAPEGKSVGVLLIKDWLSDWEDLSKDRYAARKEEAARILLSRMEKHLPGFKDALEYYEVATPKTIKRYTLNPQGSAYGYAQLPSQSGRKRVPVRSPIPNLFFASAWSEPGHGFTGSIMSGYWCAEAILQR